MTLPGALFCNTYARAMNDGETMVLPSHSKYTAMSELNAKAPSRSIFNSCAAIAIGAASTVVFGTILFVAAPLSSMTHAQTDMHVVSTPSGISGGVGSHMDRT